MPEVFYSDENIEIVSPDTPGSIPIFTEVGYSNAPTQFVDICSEGLKSYNERRKTEITLPDRRIGYPQVNSNHNDYIFFRAPFEKQKDDSWKTLGFEDMFIRMYGKSRMKLFQGAALYSDTKSHLVTINVNPENTYVFSSNARVTRPGDTQEQIEMLKVKLAASRIKMTDYLPKANYEREIVARIPFIPPTWFSSCITRPDFSQFPPEPPSISQYNIEQLKLQYKNPDILKKKTAEMTKKLEQYKEWQKQVTDASHWRNIVAPTVSQASIGGQRRNTHRRKKSHRKHRITYRRK